MAEIERRNEMKTRPCEGREEKYHILGNKDVASRREGHELGLLEREAKAKGEVVERCANCNWVCAHQNGD